MTAPSPKENAFATIDERSDSLMDNEAPFHSTTALMKNDAATQGKTRKRLVRSTEMPLQTMSELKKNGMKKRATDTRGNRPMGGEVFCSM